MISPKTIDQIFATVRVEEVIGDFVDLKKAGANLKGLSPFSNEKTPSFIVSPVKGIWKDFSSGKGGNAVGFLMEQEKFTYPEALTWLAERYNIPIEYTHQDNDEQQELRQERDSLYIANGFAQQYYTDQLFESEEGQTVGLSYLKERGFSEEVIKKFQLGYAPGGYDSFTKHATDAGYKEDVLIRAGLIKEKDGRHFDFFRERVQFTIHNLTGKVVGFGGRTLSSDKKTPKYINTPESDIYNKSKLLYGMYFAKQAVRKQDECILVEGYTDVISMMQAGVENVVASSGTALTVEQVLLIKRMTPNVLMLYDGDPAGIKAAIRGIDIILEQDMNVKVVILPEGEDPDSFVRANGAAEFIKFKEEQAKDFIFFKIDFLLKDAENDPVKKTAAVKDVIGSIGLIPDNIKRSLYIGQCARLLDMEEQLLINEVNKVRREQLIKQKRISRKEAEQVIPDRPVEHEQPTYEKPDELEMQERDVIRLLLEYGDEEIQDGVTVAQLIIHDLATDELVLDNELYRTIYNMVVELLNDEKEWTQRDFINHSDPVVSQLAIELLLSKYQISPNWDKMHDIMITDKKFMFKKDIQSSLNRFKLKKINNLIEELRNGLREAEKNEADIEIILGIQGKIQQYQQSKVKLAQNLGTVILP